MTTIIPACVACRHFHRTNLAADTCDAFPAGIPAEIWQAKNDHHEPFPGDHGIRFEPIDDTPLVAPGDTKALGSGA